MADGTPSSSGAVVEVESTSTKVPGRARRIAALLLVGIVGFSSPWLLFSAMDGRLPSMSPGLGDLLVGLVVIVSLTVASTLVHEFGHLVGAWVAGFRTMAVGIWPIVLLRPMGRPSIIRLHPRPSLGLGIVLSVPIETHDLRRRLIYVTGGGPGASLLAGVLALVGFFVLTPEPAASSSRALFLALVAGAAGLISLMFACVTLLPVHAMTDGARLLALLKGGQEAEVQKALSVLVGLSMRGIRPRMWDQSWIEGALAAPPDSPHGLMSRQYAYEWALDRGDVTEARRRLNEALAAAEGAEGSDRSELYLEAAWFAAVYEGDPALARGWFGRAGTRGSAEAHVRLTAEAAVLASEGQSTLARARLKTAGELIARGRDTFGATDVARDRIAQLTEIFDLGASVSGSPESPPPRGI